MTYRITTARRSFSTIALAGMGVIAGVGIFLAGVGTGMYPTATNGKVPQATTVAAPLPQATITVTAPPLPQATKTIKVPGATITKEVKVEVPGATKTRYLPGATKTIYRDAPAKKVAEGKKRPPAEDEAGFDCRTQGNRICGPGGKVIHTPGCYRDGKLVIAWSNFKNPEADPLYGQVKSPC